MERNRETRRGHKIDLGGLRVFRDWSRFLVREKKISKKKKEKSLSLRLTDDDKRRDSLTANNGAHVRKC